MTRFVVLSCAVMLSLPTVTVAEAAGCITFVESVPLETPLDLPQLPDAPQVWLDLVGGAQRSLDIFSFYVSPDPAGDGPPESVDP